MPNAWIAHVKKTMRHMKSKGTYAKGKGLKQVIKEAKKSWKHHRRGGADDEPAMSPPADVDVKEEMEGENPTPPGGRRRRTAKKTRRHSRRR